jgi:hypothetical protein
MMRHKLTALLFVMLLSVLNGTAQDRVEMADVMRSNGKIFVVVAVVGVVLIGLLLYLITIDRKLTAIEKKMKNNHPTS